jgi:cysteine synthase B
MLVSQADGEDIARRLARDEGLFSGVSVASACWVALPVAEQERNATIVAVVCDRCLSIGVFPA